MFEVGKAYVLTISDNEGWFSGIRQDKVRLDYLCVSINGEIVTFEPVKLAHNEKSVAKRGVTLFDTTSPKFISAFEYDGPIEKI
ncbi:hypothetical protein GCM10010924_06890 [Rhizobium wenxiniae]|uniref:Uncharacterized protein n=1 Tax=Rhizobium wenxiniae TaxID=1737357 RepID=A0A7W9Y2D8_9HYPH|nr:hypothetical protein [Rhizobium wenxiniae]MBB6160537.1 hypothetical protein [Rhizobium wenxiniae]GGF82191.1 hypothetical protein GCM10010924_06890 [Rhizobium wenxiniae]